MTSVRRYFVVMCALGKQSQKSRSTFLVCFFKRKSYNRIVWLLEIFWSFLREKDPVFIAEYIRLLEFLEVTVYDRRKVRIGIILELSYAK